MSHDGEMSSLERLCRKYRYKILHVQHQTVYVNMKIEKEFEHKHYSVFVCNIPKECSEETMLELFATIGGLYKFRIYYDDNRNPKGFAFAHYTNQGSVTCAVEQLHHLKMHGHTLKVIPDKQATKVVLGNINEAKIPFLTEMDDYVHNYCDREIPYYSCLACHVCPGRPNEYLLEFSRFRVAEAARKKLLKDRIECFGVRAYVRWYDSDWYHPDEGGNQNLW